jgi:tryptophan synthase alpha subunit
MVFHQSIQKAKEAGRLGLVIYEVPGFPDAQQSSEISVLLESDPDVSIIETTIPVSKRFSPHANETIRNAHRRAVSARNLPPNQAELGVGDTRKPRLCVLYSETEASLGLERCVAEVARISSGMIVEWEERQRNAEIAQLCERNGIELVQCVGPWMPELEVQDLLQLTNSRPLVYLMSAEKTGAPLFSTGELQRCADRIRTYRPEAAIAAGFGIKSPHDVAAIRKVQGIDGVIIGTAFLEACSKGPNEAAKYLDLVRGEL